MNKVYNTLLISIIVSNKVYS